MAACPAEEPISPTDGDGDEEPVEVIELSWTIPWPSVHFVNAIQVPEWIADIEERTEGSNPAWLSEPGKVRNPVIMSEPVE
ncbi:unnamed protein product [marine sediment metagenome]|uniref:Uncharacterized protein n=1 Tax=marine sediment metagenome TaxID=412755 RepID=X1VKB8_9ZZZZ